MLEGVRGFSKHYNKLSAGSTQVDLIASDKHFSPQHFPLHFV